MNGVPSKNRAGVVSRARSTRPESLTPLVASRVFVQHPGLFNGCQNQWLSPSTKRTTLQAQGAFHQQVPPSPPDFAEFDRMSRHRYAWLIANHPASYVLSRPFRGPLDSRAPRLFTGADEPHAACQLLQWSVPRARQRTVQTPKSCGEPPLSEQRPALRHAADRAFSGQGSLGLLDRVDPRWKRPLAPTDLPRPNRLEHPMSRNRTKPNVEFASIW